MTSEQLKQQIKDTGATHLLLPKWRERGFYTTNQIPKGEDIEDYFDNAKVIVTDEVNDITLLKKI
jgi:hypothetical protein